MEPSQIFYAYNFSCLFEADECWSYFIWIYVIIIQILMENINPFELFKE